MLHFFYWYGERNLSAVGGYGLRHSPDTKYANHDNENYVKNIYFSTKKRYDRKSELQYSEVMYEVL